MPWLNVALYIIDFVAIACLLFAFVLFAKMMIREFRRGRIEGEMWIVLPAACVAAIASSTDIVRDPYGFMRIDSMLIAWAGLQVMRIGAQVGGGIHAAMFGRIADVSGSNR